jgi:hypothetical protein
MGDPFERATNLHNIISQIPTDAIMESADPQTLYQLRQRERFQWAKLAGERGKQITGADWRKLRPLWREWGNTVGNIGGILAKAKDPAMGALIPRWKQLGENIQKQLAKLLIEIRQAEQEQKTWQEWGETALIAASLVAFGIGAVKALGKR